MRGVTSQGDDARFVIGTFLPAIPLGFCIPSLRVPIKISSHNQRCRNVPTTLASYDLEYRFHQISRLGSALIPLTSRLLGSSNAPEARLLRRQDKSRRRYRDSAKGMSGQYRWRFSEKAPNVQTPEWKGASFSRKGKPRSEARLTGRFR